MSEGDQTPLAHKEGRFGRRPAEAIRFREILDGVFPPRKGLGQPVMVDGESALGRPRSADRLSLPGMGSLPSALAGSATADKVGSTESLSEEEGVLPAKADQQDQEVAPPPPAPRPAPSLPAEKAPVRSAPSLSEKKVPVRAAVEAVRREAPGPRMMPFPLSSAEDHGGKELPTDSGSSRQRGRLAKTIRWLEGTSSRPAHGLESSASQPSAGTFRSTGTDRNNVSSSLLHPQRMEQKTVANVTSRNPSPISQGMESIRPDVPERVFNRMAAAVETLMNTRLRSNVQLQLDLSGGGQLRIRLLLIGNQLKSSFSTDSDSVRGSIREGWDHLQRQLSSRGVDADPPSFEDSSQRRGRETPSEEFFREKDENSRKRQQPTDKDGSARPRTLPAAPAVIAEPAVQDRPRLYLFA